MFISDVYNELMRTKCFHAALYSQVTVKGKEMMKMTAKKKRTTALISLVAGICVFAGAAFANYTTSGGYSVYKKAIIGALGENNYTMESRMSLKIDDTVLSDGSVKEMFSAEGDANLYRKESTVYAEDGERKYESSLYMQDKTEIRIYDYGDGEGARANIRDGEESKKYYNPKSSTTLGGGIDMSRETDQKMIRFVELLADTFMGDLKNNFVYVSGDDNSKKYELVLDGMQVPEFVNAGLSAMFSSMSNEEYNQDDPALALGKDPVVRSASTVFTVDNEGRLLHNDLRAELVGRDSSGKEHALVLEVSINMSDYGTTTPPKADIGSLNIEYQESRDSGRRADTNEMVMSTANDDGTVTITYADGTTAVVNKETNTLVEINKAEAAEVEE